MFNFHETSILQQKERSNQKIQEKKLCLKLKNTLKKILLTLTFSPSPTVQQLVTAVHQGLLANRADLASSPRVLSAAIP